jgi:hypothetical protein
MNNNIAERNKPEVSDTGKEISRRQFLETSAAGAAFTALGIGMAADLLAAADPTTGSSAITPSPSTFRRALLTISSVVST